MEARRVLLGRGSASRDAVWSTQAAAIAGWICLAAGVGRGAAFSGFVGLAPALVLGSLYMGDSLPGDAAWRRPDARRHSTAALPRPVGGPLLPWLLAVAAAIGFASAGTLRSTAGMLLLLAVVAGVAGRLRSPWHPILVGVLCGGLALAAQPGLSVFRLMAACLLQAGSGAAMAAAALLAAAEMRRSDARAGVGWAVVAGALAVGACGAAVSDIRSGLLSGALVAGFSIWSADGPGSGALVGALAGVMCMPALGPGAFAPGAAAVAGAAAGLCRRHRPLLAPVGYAAATLVVAAVAVPSDWSWSLGAGVGASAWLAAGAGVLRAGARVRSGDRGAGGGAYRPSLEERLRAAAATCLELSRGLADAPMEEGVPQAEERGLRIAEDVCPGCPALAACWERKLPRARRMVAGLWRGAQAETVTWQDVGGPDTIFCLRPREMAEAANRHAALIRQREAFVRLMEASRRSAITPLVGIGRVLADLAEEVAATGEPLPAPGAGAESPASRMPTEERWSSGPDGGRLGFEAAAATLPRPGGVVSGDSFRCRPLPGDRLALVLSDGMGSGGPAAVTSATAVEHLLACLASGMAVEQALLQTNDHMLADSSAERFATIELVVIQLRGALLEWYSMGCPPGFLLHSRGVREWGGGGLPAGILSAPEIRSGRARLRAGDVLVLLSDGVLDRSSGGVPPGNRGGRSRWVAEWLRAERSQHGSPSEAARGLLAAARGRATGEHDDLTVLACRFWGGTEGGGGKAYGGNVAGIGAAGGPGVPPLAGR